MDLKNNHIEEIRNIYSEFERKFSEKQKDFDKENSELKNTIMNLEKELLLTNKKTNLAENAEIKEFQKKYITQMLELQNSFEEFKIKTYEETNKLKKQKDEANKRTNFFQQQLERMQIDWEQNENIYNENYINMKNKLDSFKIFMKNNEILKNQLDLCKSEVSFLKLKIIKLENSEKNLQNILLEKTVNQLDLDSGLGLGLEMKVIPGTRIGTASGSFKNGGMGLGMNGIVGGQINLNNLNTNFNNSDCLYMTDRVSLGNSNYNTLKKINDYSDLNSNLNLIPHLQSSNHFNHISSSERMNNHNHNHNQIQVNNRNSPYPYSYQKMHNVNMINSLPKKRSNSKSISSNASNFIYLF